MVGGVADQLESEKKRTKKKKQTTLKILESFILGAPIVSMKPIPQRLQNFRL
jgi:hypothetical protein